MDKFVIGSVTTVKGVSVKAKINPNLYQTTYFYDGEIYRGVSINEFILIRKGYHDLVGKVEGEEIIENKYSHESELEQKKFDRFVDIKILGYFQDGEFNPGIKFLPMIDDKLFLISDKLISKIYTFNPNKSKRTLSIGSSLLEGISIELPINGIYNSHIGIFGNTGSGKSNTLAKLYVSLFELMEKNEKFPNSSTFLLIDFNGEYNQISNKFKNRSEYIKLSTQSKKGDQKLDIRKNDFWDDELLSVIFSATEKTQKPFLTHLVKNRNHFGENLTDYLNKTLSIMFDTNQSKETINLIRSITHLLPNKVKIENELSVILWHTQQQKYYHIKNGANRIFNTPKEALDVLPSLRDIKIPQVGMDVFTEVTLRATLQLINSVSKNYVQYEHISPLINKISAMSNSLSKVINVTDTIEEKEKKNIKIISLKNCNQDTKKSIPMMLAKCSFIEHKKNFENNKSFHFIIDEAHNILSDSSTRESESWKDYRLELFEEIIKEGRKFGFFLTIASQRPSDISPTIISQIHNYFLHRLINENDLFLLKNSISSLDSSSRSQIPILPPGACILSGTAFHTPMIIQVKKLVDESSPQSNTIDLEGLWEL
ncbi:ATP-binding protein [Serratia liquefaciens]|uniref:ATP-binding protein n=1 Tax=Serratia liquefaciens TaxID=614 RepID=UPI0018E486B8|nr:ATP-binding protein [Serratia liquefaciens]MBI6162547.1 ATP-binding protein [Serratia liquefaciens]